MWAYFKKQPPIRSLIGEGTVLHGEVRFSDGLRVDGEVHGDIVAVGDEHNILVISEKARVHGKVSAGHVIINGTSSARCSPTSCWNCSPRRVSRAMCATRRSRCTRARRSTASCAP